MQKKEQKEKRNERHLIMYMENDKYNQKGDVDMKFEFIKEYLKKDKIKIVNQVRTKDLFETYAIVQNLLRNAEETTVEIESGKLELGDVTIRITALTITIFDLNNLMRIIQKADSVDIYPLTDGRVRLDIQFNDVYSVYVTN